MELGIQPRLYLCHYCQDPIKNNNKERQKGYHFKCKMSKETITYRKFNYKIPELNELSMELGCFIPEAKYPYQVFGYQKKRNDNYVNCLVLNNKGLLKVPEAVRSFTRLKRLDLNGNQIQKLPEWIGELSNLSWLDLRGNGIQSLPETIGKLVHLTWLWIDNNSLSSLPSNFEELIKLEYLDLSGSVFLKKPEVLRRLPKLHNLKITVMHEQRKLDTKLGNRKEVEGFLNLEDGIIL